jgi:branched-chain amino acid transport system substrate-binding protein
MSTTWFGRRRVLPLTVGLSVVALAASACSSSSSASSGAGSGSSSSSEITIGVTANLTGTDSAWDVPTTRAFTEHINEINAKGGVNGHKIKLITLNSNSDEATAVSNAKELVYQDNVLAVYGFGDTLQANAGLPLTTSAKVPTLATSWGTANLTSPYAFQLSNNLTFASDVLIKYLAKRYKTIAITAETTSRGNEEVTAQTAAVKADGFSGKVNVIRYSPDASDFTPMVTQLKNDHPDVILNNGASAADVTAPMKAAQAAGLKTPWAGITMAIPNVVTVGGPTLLNGSLTAVFVDYSKPTVQQLASLVKTKWHDQINYGYVQGWDAATIFAAALAKPGATDSRDKLQAAMESLKNVTVLGGPAGYTVSFKPGTGNSHAGYLEPAMTVQQYQPDGSLAPAK